jgi:hypothetical protein
MNNSYYAYSYSGRERENNGKETERKRKKKRKKADVKETDGEEREGAEYRLKGRDSVTKK